MDNEIGKSFLITIGTMIMAGLLIAGLTLLSLPAYILSGIVFASMWSWFIVPGFGLPIIGTKTAIGVCLLSAVLNNRYRHTPKETKFGHIMLAAYLVPLMIWGVGYIFHTYSFWGML